MLKRVILGFLYLLSITIHPLMGYKTRVRLYFDGKEKIKAAGASNKILLFAENRKLRTSDHLALGPKASSYTKSSIFSITQIECYKKKDICLVTGNNEIEAYEVSKGGATFLARYLFKKEDKLAATFMKISPILDSDYFISCGTIEEGLLRWRLDNYKHYARLSFKNEYIPAFLSALDLQSLRGTLFALMTLRTWNKLIVVDVSSMAEIRKLNNCRGLIGYFDVKPEKFHIVLAYELKLSLKSYKDGTLAKQVNSDYYITGCKTVPFSYMAVITTGDFIRVYNLLDNDPRPRSYIYSYKFMQSVYHLEFNDYSRQFFVFGNGFISGLTIMEPEQGTQCNPVCRGCSEGVSSLACIDCKGNFTKDEKSPGGVTLTTDVERVNSGLKGGKGDKCQVETAKNFDGYVGNFSSLDWSLADQEACVSNLNFRQVVFIGLVVIGIVVIFSILGFLVEYILPDNKEDEKVKEKKESDNANEGKASVPIDTELNNEESMVINSQKYDLPVQQTFQNEVFMHPYASSIPSGQEAFAPPSNREKIAEEKNDKNEEIESSVVINRMTGRETARSLGLNNATLFSRRSNYDNNDDLKKAIVFDVQNGGNIFDDN